MSCSAPQFFVHYCNIDSSITVISVWSFLVLLHHVGKVCSNMLEKGVVSIFRVTEFVSREGRSSCEEGVQARKLGRKGGDRNHPTQ
jgi:hypothetical protein